MVLNSKWNSTVECLNFRFMLVLLTGILNNPYEMNSDDELLCVDSSSKWHFGIKL